jgi:hypothetical protein
VTIAPRSPTSDSPSPQVRIFSALPTLDNNVKAESFFRPAPEVIHLRNGFPEHLLLAVPSLQTSGNLGGILGLPVGRFESRGQPQPSAGEHRRCKLGCFGCGTGVEPFDTGTEAQLRSRISSGSIPW